MISKDKLSSYFFPFIVMVVVGLISVFIYLANKSWEKKLERQRIFNQQKVNECYSHGGIWTPVGGDVQRTVYGCVFPPQNR